MPRKKNGRANPLKPVCVTGLVLALILSWGMVFFALSGERSPKEPQKNTFARELENYDLLDAPKMVLEGENPERLERRLSRLQKEAGSVEEQLSVLKRRRILALTDRRYIPAYEKAAREAAEAYAFSAPIAAVAADALVLSGGPLSEETLALLGSYAPRVSQPRFELLELSVRVLSGDLRDPARAAAVPGLENLLAAGFSAREGEGAGFSGRPLPESARRTLLADEFLLRAVKGDIPGASIRLDSLLSVPEAGRETAPASARMGAEFFYDHHNPLKAAELFSRLAGETSGAALRGTGAEVSGERDMARAADALVLAGEIPGARNIWLALSADTNQPAQAEDAAAVQGRYRSLYNLAASSPDRKEEASWLEKLFSLRSQRSQAGYELDSAGISSVIRYTRLLDTPRAIAVLEDEGMRKNPLLDLELLRRGLEGWPPLRASAEVWLLLGRGAADESLYEWAAWYFDHQRLYNETERVLAEAERKGMSGPWLDLHRGLALVREEKIAEGEKIFEEAGRRRADWRIFANLGRIQESRRALSAALEYYEAAAALVTGNNSAARVQLRLSRCLEALGRSREGRRALEHALELDPDNLNIRRELRRFD